MPGPSEPERREPTLGVLMFIPVRHMEQRIVDALVAAGHPITLAQAKLAARIDPAGSRLSTLAEAAQVTKQSAGYLVDQLEAAGYVERVPDPTDARARLVRITEHARSTMEVAYAEERRVEAEWEGLVGADAIEQMRETLRRLRTITDPYA